jgi:hypothetical protein
MKICFNHLMAIATLGSLTSHAETINSSGNWGDSTKWSPTSVPDAIDAAATVMVTPTAQNVYYQLAGSLLLQRATAAELQQMITPALAFRNKCVLVVGFLFCSCFVDFDFVAVVALLASCFLFFKI